MKLCGVLACAFAASLGCAGARNLTITVRPRQPHVIRLIAVYPTALRFEAPAYRSYELSMDQVEAVLATGRFMALGPDEFVLRNWTSNALYGQTNLSGKLTALGLSPSDVLGLRTWIERREQRGSQQLTDPNGKPTGHARSAEVTYIVHADLLDPDSDEPLAAGSLETAVDPFAEHPAWDDAPELRQAVKTLVGDLLGKAGAALQSRPQVTELPFGADWIPWGEERFAMPGRPPLQAQLASLDPVSAEALRLLRLSYFDSELSNARQNAMLALPAGLWVRAVPSRLRAAGLEVGDLITSVEGDPAAGPQTFLRWASTKAPGSPIKLTLLRHDQIVHLAVPAPAR
jgi:hypothetical protein